MYSKIIPIGSFCQVADQLNEKQLAYARTPWEFTVTPLQALLDAIRDDGRSFGVHVERYDNDGTVICRSYGHLHHHDFSRNFEEGNKVMPLSEAEKANCRSKFLHKMETFRNAARSDGKKLFIRLAGEGNNPVAWPYLNDLESMKYSRLNELAQTLEEYGGPSFDLALVHYSSLMRLENDAHLDPRVRIFPLPDSVERQSTGDSGPWLEVFEALGIMATA